MLRFDAVPESVTGLLARLAGFFSLKYPATDPFTVIRSLAWFEDGEMEPDPVPLRGQNWGWVKKRVMAAVAEL